MIDRPPQDLSDIWDDGPPGPRPAEPSPRRRAKTKPRRTRPQSRPRWLSVLGYGGLAFACLGAGLLAFLLIAAPVDIVRDRLIEQVKARTGRDLVVSGATSLSLFPSLSVSLSDVSLSAPEGMEAPPMLVVPRVEAGLRLWSLLMARPAVERVTLHRPIIELSVDAQGRRSWNHAVTRPRSLRPAPAGTDTSDTQQQPGEPSPAVPIKTAAALSKLGVASIRVLDATLRYRDERSGAHSEIDSLNLTLAADNPTGPLQVDGALVVRGAPIAIAGTVSPAVALLADQPVQVAVKVSGAPFEGTYEGTLALAAGISLDGTLNLKAASAHALGDWLGRPLPAGGASDAVAVSVQLKAGEGRVTLSNLDAIFGDTTLAGSLALDTQQERHRLNGNLRVSDLDFGRLLLKPGRGAERTQEPSGPAAATPPASAPATAKRAEGRGWSDDPINLPILGLLDANLAVTAGRLTYKDLKTGPSRLLLALESGLAKVTLEEIELYGGRGRGILTLDATGEVLVTGANLKLDGVAIRPLFSDALRFPWIEGRGRVSLALAGQGASERQIVEGLNGKVDIAAADGAITGLDIGKIVRNLQHARLPSLTPNPDEKTPFSELAATFTITNGVAKNQDLRLVSAHLQLNGEGTLDLGPRQMDYTVRTKIGGGTPEPDATIKVGTIEVPVSIVGPWEKPAFGIKGQEQLTGALKQIGKNLKSQDVKDALKGLLRGDGEKRVKPRDLLEKLLKKD